MDFRTTLLSLLMLLLCAAPAFSQDYDMKESFCTGLDPGEKQEVMFAVLDTKSFSYYGENYSIRLMGSYEDSVNLVLKSDSEIIGTKLASEIKTGEYWLVNIDRQGQDDAKITLVYPGNEAAKLLLELLKNPEKEALLAEEAGITQNTSQSSPKTNSSKSVQQQNSSAAPAQSNSSKPIVLSSAARNTSSQPSSAGSQSQQASTPTAAASGALINVNINISPGSGIGLLITVFIVLGGLIIYKIVRKMILSG